MADLTPSSTIAEACALWLIEKRRSQTVEASSIETYEATVRTVVLPACGAVTLQEMNAGRCDRIIQRVLDTRSPSAAKKLRGVLRQVLGLAIRHGALTTNPVQHVQRLPGTVKRESSLTTEQLIQIRGLLARWTRPRGPRPDANRLEDGIDIMLGTSARIGEAMALRRCDVDIDSDAPSILIASTLTQTKTDGLKRKNSPKQPRQIRRVSIPGFTVAAIRRRLDGAGPEGTAFLFVTKSGAAYSVSNFERLIRSFREDHLDELQKMGIDTEEFTPHLFRRTAATTIEREYGISLASRLLGHANENITRNSYVVSAEAVDPRTAGILDEFVGKRL
ncbi:tyrosine-type recombinase/integrase [Rhodoglobus aureus]|uniref:tyrosine-type recombinase/integrase n=1 Tax=Rhodoglobus aureus TaxID=191497 RepID=UPI0031DF5013